MKWQQERAEIDRMLADGELERVQASRLSRGESPAGPTDGTAATALRQDAPTAARRRISTDRHSELHADDIRDDLPKIRAVVDIAERVLDNMPVY